MEQCAPRSGPRQGQLHCQFHRSALEPCIQRGPRRSKLPKLDRATWLLNEVVGRQARRCVFARGRDFAHPAVAHGEVCVPACRRDVPTIQAPHAQGAGLHELLGLPPQAGWHWLAWLGQRLAQPMRRVFSSKRSPPNFVARCFGFLCTRGHCSCNSSFGGKRVFSATVQWARKLLFLPAACFFTSGLCLKIIDLR